MAEKKILITGSGGYIGINLLKYLSNKDIKCCLLEKNSINEVPDNMTHLKLDLTSDDWEKELPPVDSIIHLAQSSMYRDAEKGSRDMYKVNLESTFRLLEWGKENSISKFIFTSTGNVYKPGREIFDVYDELDPLSYYTATKLSSEFLAREYRSYYQIDICRLFTVFGPDQSGMLIPKIIERVKKKEPIFLTGKAGIYLTPVHVDNVCAILFSLIENDSSVEINYYNLAGKERVSLAEIVENIGKYLNIDPVIKIKEGEESSLCGKGYDPFNAVKEWFSVLDPETYIKL